MGKGTTKTKTNDGAGPSTAGLSPQQIQNLKRCQAMWAEVVAHDPTMTGWNDGVAIGTQTPKLVLEIPANPAAKLPPTKFFVSVAFTPGFEADTLPGFYGMRNGSMIWSANSRVGLGDRPDDFPETKPYEELLKGLTGADRNEKRRIHQIMHELTHARIYIESRAGWPPEKRLLNLQDTLLTIYAKAAGDEYEAVKSAFVAAQLARHHLSLDFRNQLSEWYLEKFASQYSFSRFGVRVENVDIAQQLGKELLGRHPDPKALDNFTTKLVKLFDKIDHIVPPPSIGGNTGAAPIPGTKEEKDAQPDMGPVRHGWLDPTPSNDDWQRDRPAFGNSFGRTNSAFVNRPTVIPGAPDFPMPTTPIYRASQPSIINTAYHPQPAYVPPPPVFPAQTGWQPIDQHNYAPPPPIYRPEPQAYVPPPPIDRPMQTTGSGWDPNRFGFSNPVDHMTLDPYTPHTVMVPAADNGVGYHPPGPLVPYFVENRD